MSATFTAIDFETAQGKRWSICQVGLVRVENGRITSQLSKLVCPPDNFRFPFNTSIHGIAPQHACSDPTFAALWPELKPYIHNQKVVAHNGAFDFNCLRQTLDYYRLTHPDCEQACTLKIYKKGWQNYVGNIKSN